MKKISCGILCMLVICCFSCKTTKYDYKKDKQLTFTVDSVTFTMTKVKGGTFVMGATEEQGNNVYDYEKPAHSVTLSDYYIGTTEVTQALWQAVMGEDGQKSMKKINSQYGKGDNFPMCDVNWKEIIVFLQKLNAKTGMRFRLPTEAEWEYAARGGKKSKHFKYAGSNDLNAVAWYWCNSGDSIVGGSSENYYLAQSNHNRLHPVAQKLPNELGLYDMCGNVNEWCSDNFDKDFYKRSPNMNPIFISPQPLQDYHVIRGGHWKTDDTLCCRISYRSCPIPEDYCTGFRLALSLENNEMEEDTVSLDSIAKMGPYYIFHSGLMLAKNQNDSYYKNVYQPKKCKTKADIPTLLPKEYAFDDYWLEADFDEDGRVDYMVRVRDTNSCRFEYEYAYTNDYREQKDSFIDRNPRGYMLVMNRDNYYEVTSYNYECFPSENEEGGTANMPPEIDIYYDQSHQLNINYNHGRYGVWWKFCFRYRNENFELLKKEYDEECFSAVLDTTYFEKIDYEHGIATYRKLINKEDCYKYDENDECPEPIYEEWSDTFEVDESKFQKLSEGQWYWYH